MRSFYSPFEKQFGASISIHRVERLNTNPLKKEIWYSTGFALCRIPLVPGINARKFQSSGQRTLMRMRRQGRMFLGTNSAQAFKQNWTAHLSPGDLSPDFLYGTPPVLGHRISATAIIRPDFTGPRPRLTPRTSPRPERAGVPPRVASSGTIPSCKFIASLPPGRTPRNACRSVYN